MVELAKTSCLTAPIGIRVSPLAEAASSAFAPTIFTLPIVFEPATNPTLPIVLLPVGMAFTVTVPVTVTVLLTDTSPISTPSLALSLPIALVPATNPTLPIVFDPAGIEGKVNTSTSPILLVPAGKASLTATTRAVSVAAAAVLAALTTTSLNDVLAGVFLPFKTDLVSCAKSVGKTLSLNFLSVPFAEILCNLVCNLKEEVVVVPLVYITLKYRK